MRLITSYSKLKFDSKIATKLLDKAAQKIFKDAVKAWVVTAEQIIPVWSGASRGTLIKVGNLVGYNVTAGINRELDPNALQRVGNRTFLGEQKSSATLNLTPGEYSFAYGSDLEHLNVNENTDATQFGIRLKRPGPYNFRKQADDAFNASLQKGLRTIKFRLILRNSFKVTQSRSG